MLSGNRYYWMISMGLGLGLGLGLGSAWAWAWAWGKLIYRRPGKVDTIAGSVLCMRQRTGLAHGLSLILRNIHIFS